MVLFEMQFCHYKSNIQFSLHLICKLIPRKKDLMRQSTITQYFRWFFNLRNCVKLGIFLSSIPKCLFCYVTVYYFLISFCFCKFIYLAELFLITCNRIYIRKRFILVYLLFILENTKCFSSFILNQLKINGSRIFSFFFFVWHILERIWGSFCA